jgi:hypothetical protein
LLGDDLSLNKLSFFFCRSADHYRVKKRKRPQVSKANISRHQNKKKTQQTVQQGPEEASAVVVAAQETPLLPAVRDQNFSQIVQAGWVVPTTNEEIIDAVRKKLVKLDDGRFFLKDPVTNEDFYYDHNPLNCLSGAVGGGGEDGEEDEDDEDDELGDSEQDDDYQPPSDHSVAEDDLDEFVVSSPSSSEEEEEVSCKLWF